jgi:hypothetical protein
MIAEAMTAMGSEAVEESLAMVRKQLAAVEAQPTIEARQEM